MKKNKDAENISPEENVTETEGATNTQKTVNKVGSLLKEMRLQKGLRIPDVSKKLCIRKIYLEAIEESNYEEIPPLPYGIGFIRSYAEYLGLNSSNILELYKEETNSKPESGIYMLEVQNEATVPNRKYLLVSLLAIVAIYAGWHFYNSRSAEDEETVAATSEVVELTDAEQNADSQKKPLVVEDYTVTSESDNEEDGVSDKNEEQAPEVSQVKIVEETFPVEAEKQPVVDKDKSATVVIKVKEDTWVEVKDQNKLYLSKVLQAGAEYVVPEDGKGMILSIGNVKGSDVNINGKLTTVARPNKKTNIALDPFLAPAH